MGIEQFLHMNNTYLSLEISLSITELQSNNIIFSDLPNLTTVGIVTSKDAKTYDVESLKTILSTLIKHYPQITRLNLEGNNIGDTGVEILVPALIESKNLTQLNLSRNNIGDKGVSALASSLIKCPNLKELYLIGNNIGDAGMDALTPALMNYTLQALYLENNKITPDRVQELTKSVHDNYYILNVSVDHTTAPDISIMIDTTTKTKDLKGIIYRNNALSEILYAQASVQDLIKLYSNSSELFEEILIFGRSDRKNVECLLEIYRQYLGSTIDPDHPAMHSTETEDDKKYKKQIHSAKDMSETIIRIFADQPEKIIKVITSIMHPSKAQLTNLTDTEYSERYRSDELKKELVEAIGTWYKDSDESQKAMSVAFKDALACNDLEHIEALLAQFVQEGLVSYDDPTSSLLGQDDYCSE